MGWSDRKAQAKQGALDFARDLLPHEVQLHHRVRGTALQRRGLSPGSWEAHVSHLLSPHEGIAEGLAVWGGILHVHMAVGGEGIQGKGVAEARSCSERRRRLLLTSSAYWTLSTAYFSWKCSLEWILEGKNKEHQGQGLATSCPQAPARP